jgi:hypothetical protein
MHDTNTRALTRPSCQSVGLHAAAARARERGSDACAELAATLYARAEILDVRRGEVRRPRARLGPAVSVLDKHFVTQSWRIR